MKIIVTGGNGQLGRAFKALEHRYDHELFCYGSKDLDITNAALTMKVISQVQPDTIIHAGAYTKVDLAEQAVDNAFRVNVVGTQNVAAAALKNNCKMVYVSTDFVFDGKKESPYTEFDDPNPLNVYGKTKLEGEKIAMRICPKLFITRTAWLYGDGANFVKTIVANARQNRPLNVVNDQTGTPTYTVDLATAILKLVVTDAYGTYHMSNNGSCTWYEFAQEIIKNAGLSVPVKAITSQELKRPAVRPEYSVMRNYMLELTSGDSFRHWREALAEYMASGGV